jgi:hypothetical protein
MIPRSLLPEQYHESAFIAGGFAACPALASDVDIWVSVEVGQCNAVRAGILQHLIDSNVSHQEEDGEGSPRRRFQDDRTLANSQLLSTFEGYHTILRLRRVASVELPGHTLPYHLIVIEGSIDEVLASFDISTHQVALTTRGVVRGEHWTPIHVPPVVITHKYTTPERLCKVRERYGFDKSEVTNGEGF